MTSSNLAREAYSKIIDMIIDGTLKPGEILQEAALGNLLDMSRTPVREAIKRIESEGLAELQGRFTRLRRVAPEEVEEIFFIRLSLEPDCANAAGAIAPEALDEIEALTHAIMREGPGESDRQWHVDGKFHAMIADAAGNRTVAKVISDLHKRTCIFDHRVVPERFLKGCEEHLEIIGALRRGDTADASEKMRCHLENARDAILKRLDGFQPVEERHR
ncbi:GntR family transcriptional regulator [Tropicimonas sp. IMCC6043]|uniref:GntR family transcriptional regulator n=1 Tax=Tropicimonas sp. IMCC6043 TaxID=2510645 RepID=UPI00101C46CF|nr:GntR family transcriptional regulator [Tropicimonas sp. IMCC6043]RYH06086.1 GntR family transcriptional regulator [Tropicimonas sp. IMCC6043]